MKITQEKLAELIDVSTTHMSGIENGKTKFSFKRGLLIANVLGMSMDELLCGSLVQGKPVLQNEYSALLQDCTADEAYILVNTLKAMKKFLREKK